jgi:hypothetical protein
LNAYAEVNMPNILVTLLVFHLEMSSLNIDLSWNKKSIRVTCDTSQSLICP